MKKYKQFILILFFISIIFILSSCKLDKRQKINIYNWGDYIDPTILKEFEKEFNVKVNYNTFSTNEDMYIAIKKGGTSYDVVFPSDYMIERMIKEDLLEKIDKKVVENIKHIDKDLLGHEFDKKNDYSIPYFWGTVGIAYNKNYVRKEEAMTWDILWNKKYNKEILMLDSQRDSFAIALKRMGKSMNSKNIEELEEVKESLIKQKKIVYAYVGDEVKDLMLADEAQVAVVWSGDAFAMQEESDNIGYEIPKEGTNLWFDCVVIPKNSKNKKLANEFINFINRPEIAARNSEEIGYSTANLKAKKYISSKMRNSEVAFPKKEKIKNSEVFRDPKDMLKIYNDLWIEVKAIQM